MIANGISVLTIVLAIIAISACEDPAKTVGGGNTGISPPAFLVGTEWGGEQNESLGTADGVIWRFTKTDVYSSTYHTYSRGFRRTGWIVSDITQGNTYKIVRSFPGEGELSFEWTRRGDTLAYIQRDSNDQSPGETISLRQCGTPTERDRTVEIPQKYQGVWYSEYDGDNARLEITPNNIILTGRDWQKVNLQEDAKRNKKRLRIRSVDDTGHEIVETYCWVSDSRYNHTLLILSDGSLGYAQGGGPEGWSRLR